MPITKSAQKALRQNTRRKVKNLDYKKKIKDLNKKMDLYVAEKNQEKIKETIPLVYKTLDKMVKKGIIKPSTAARRKSKIAKLKLSD